MGHFFRLDGEGNVKVADFGLSEDVYTTGYFRLNTLMEELRANAPDVVELLSHLARCERFDNEKTDDSHSIAVLRSTTAH